MELSPFDGTDESPSPSDAATPGDGAEAPRPEPSDDPRLAGLGPLDQGARAAVLAALSRSGAHEALLAAIVAQPHDDAPRLIYADWLDEQDDRTQAEFIRVQCEAAALDASSSECRAARARAAELLEADGHEWVRALAGFGFDVAQVQLDDFDRGLLVAAQVTTPFTVPERLFLIAPTLQRVVLRGSHSRKRLFDLPQTERLTHLTIELISGDDFAAFVAGTRWKSLEMLGLYRAWLQPDVVYSLGRASLPALRHLSLSGSVLNDSGARALASTFLLTQLETLDLTAADLGPRGVLDLSRSSLASGLKTLVLDDNVLDDDALIALADSPYLLRLRRLSLSNPVLSRPPRLGRARNLFTRAGVAALLRSPVVDRLERLELLGVGLDDAAALAIASASLPALKSIDLRDNDELTPDVVKELIETLAERGVDVLI